jgi:hypothetical protein
MILDPVVEDVRAVRKAIEIEYGNDPAKYRERLCRLERKYASCLVSRVPKPALASTQASGKS